MTYTPYTGGSYITQTTWFIDPQNSSTTASDHNDGLTSSTPLKSFAEFSRRLGVNSQIGQNTNVFMLSDGLSTDPLNLHITVHKGSFLSFYGASSTTIGAGATSVQTGTFSSVTNLNAATNTPTQATDSLGRSWTTLIGNRVRDLTTNAIAWVAKDLTGGAVRLSSPSTWVNGTASLVTTTTFNTTNTYQVETLRKIWLGDNFFTTSFFSTQGTVFFQDLDFQGSTTSLNAYGTPITVRGCHSSIIVSIAGDGRSVTIFSNCCMQNEVLVTGGLFKLEAGVAMNANIGNILNSGIGVSQVDGDALIQGGGGLQCRAGTMVLGRVGIFDAVANGSFNPRGSAICVGVIINAGPTPGGYCRAVTLFHSISAIYGSGNAGYGIDVFPGHRMDYQSTASLTVTGTSGDFILGEDSTAATPFDKSASPPQYKAAITGSWTNFTTVVSSGGFGGNAQNPERGCGIFKG